MPQTPDLESRNKTIDDCFKSVEVPVKRSMTNLLAEFYFGLAYPILYDVIFFHWWDYMRMGSIIKPQKDEAILEIAAGYPLHLPYSSRVGDNGRYVGLDKSKITVNVSNALLKKLKRDAYNYHCTGDASEIPCEDNLFDKAVGVNRTESNYKEVHRVLKPNGVYYERLALLPSETANHRFESITRNGLLVNSTNYSRGIFPFIQLTITATKAL
jgi:ubiquinone/menaquinone biosynthesis C-methylase UbiE